MNMCNNYATPEMGDNCGETYPIAVCFATV
jgi:hypothetical protein